MDRLRYWLAPAGGLLLYALLAAITTWPLVIRAGTSLVIGTEVARTVPLFNVWTLWWNVDRLEAGLEHYWDAPIFYPLENTFALSEPQPITMATAPLVWASGSIVWAANVYLLVSLVLNGWLAERCLLRLRIPRGVAVGGGAAMTLLPIVHWQIGVMQLVPLWGVLWTWLALDKLMQSAEPAGEESDATAESITPAADWKPGVLRGGELGGAFSLTMMTCAHHALFLALLTTVAIPILGRRLFRRQTWGMLGVAAAVSAILVGPLVWQLRRMPAEETTRRADLVRRLSLVPGDYAAVYGVSALGGDSGWARRGWYLSPGWLKVAWAAVGIGAGFAVRRWRRWTGLIVWVGAVAFALSCGARLDLFGWQPWWTVTEWVPGFAQVRNAFRFAYFVQVCVVLLAAQGVAAAMAWTLQTRVSARGKVAAGLVALAGSWAAVDPWPPRLNLGPATNVAAHRDWLEFLRDADRQYRDSGQFVRGDRGPTPGRRDRPGVLCLPMAKGDHVGGYEISTEWMVLGSRHGVPLVNGYSGFFPDVYYQLRDTLERKGVTGGIVNRLHAEGVRWIVVDRLRFDLPWGEFWSWGPVEVRRVYRSGRGVDVYRIRRQGEQPRPAGGNKPGSVPDGGVSD